MCRIHLWLMLQPCGVLLQPCGAFLSTNCVWNCPCSSSEVKYNSHTLGLALNRETRNHFTVAVFCIFSPSTSWNFVMSLRLISDKESCDEENIIYRCSFHMPLQEMKLVRFSFPYTYEFSLFTNCCPLLQCSPLLNCLGFCMSLYIHCHNRISAAGCTLKVCDIMLFL